MNFWKQSKYSHLRTRGSGCVFTLTCEGVSQGKRTCIRNAIYQVYGAGPSTQGGWSSLNRKVWIVSVISTVTALLIASMAVAFAGRSPRKTRAARARRR